MEATNPCFLIRSCCVSCSTITASPWPGRTRPTSTLTRSTLTRGPVCLGLVSCVLTNLDLSFAEISLVARSALTRPNTYVQVKMKKPIVKVDKENLANALMEGQIRSTRSHWELLFKLGLGRLGPSPCGLGPDFWPTKTRTKSAGPRSPPLCRVLHVVYWMLLSSMNCHNICLEAFQAISA